MTSLRLVALDGLPGYLAGSDGHIYSTKSGAARRLAESYRKEGEKYRCVTLSVPTKRGHKTVSVHCLIAQAFLGPKPDRTEVRHWDGNSENNVPSNLRWGTTQDNSDDKKRHGTMARGQRIASSKLTPDKVIAARARLLAGEKLKSVASDLGVTIGAAWFIKTGRNWGWLSEAPR